MIATAERLAVALIVAMAWYLRRPVDVVIIDGNGEVIQ